MGAHLVVLLGMAVCHLVALEGLALRISNGAVPSVFDRIGSTAWELRRDLFPLPTPGLLQPRYSVDFLIRRPANEP